MTARIEHALSQAVRIADEMRFCRECARAALLKGNGDEMHWLCGLHARLTAEAEWWTTLAMGNDGRAEA